MAVVEEEIVAPVLVHQRRSRPAAGQHVVHGGQRFEVHVDLGGQVFGLGSRRRHAHGDQLADVADLAGGQDGLHGGLEARQRGVGPDRRDALQIVGNEHTIADARAGS